MHARLLRQTLRGERARLEEARLGLGNARRKADETEIARRAAQKQLERQANDVASLEKLVAELEGQLVEIKRRPAKRYHVLDRQPPRGLPIWEVPARARPGAPVAEVAVASWAAGRTYLVTALTPHEAALRVANKFPPQAGFDIGNPAPSQLMSQSAIRPASPSAAMLADPPAYQAESGEGAGPAAADPSLAAPAQAAEVHAHAPPAQSPAQASLHSPVP
jgi:hypothetical protein